MEQNYDNNYWEQPCPKVDCKKKECACGLKFVDIPVAFGDDSPSSKYAPENGVYCNAIVKYEANGAIYIYSEEGIPVKVKDGNAS